MSAKATIFKAKLHIADMNRGYYGDHALTLARHPSETDERLMTRLLAFALHADPALVFANGLTANDEPDLWLKDRTDHIELWIAVGMPDEKLVRKACARASRIFIYGYTGRPVSVWWNHHRATFEQIENLTVLTISTETIHELTKLTQRTMTLHCTIQDGLVWLADQHRSVEIAMTPLKITHPSVS